MAEQHELTLRELTAPTLYQVLELSVLPEQEPYVASNAWSVAQAYFHPEAWFRGIYHGDTPVGFVMLEDWSQVPEKFTGQPIVLWRFMIADGKQRMGYGRRSLKLVEEHVRKRTELDHYLTSCVPGPSSPKDFYLSCGFVDTGEVVDGEELLRFDL
jgi:diamine N-acetyltransferase